MLPARGALWLVLINFLTSLSASILSPIIPLYFKTFVNNDAYVGYITSFTALVLLIGALSSAYILNKFKKSSVLLSTLIFTTLSYYILMFIKGLVPLLVLLFFRTFATILTILIIGLYVRNSVAHKSSLGKTEGFYFAFLNLAWLIGPLLGGSLAESFSFNFLFGISSIFSLLATVIAYSKLPKDEALEKNNKVVWSNVKDFFKNKNLFLLYLTSVGIAIWWATLYTFLPLYLTEHGIEKIVIGYAFFLMVLPLIFLELPIGRYADKYGIKKFLRIGFLILFLFSFSTYFIDQPLLIVTALVIGCTGAAFIEPLREAYLFKTQRKQDGTRFYGIYATGFDIGYLIGPFLLSSILLYTNNFKYLFLATAFFMFIFFFTTSFIKDTT